MDSHPDVDHLGVDAYSDSTDSDENNSGACGGFALNDNGHMMNYESSETESVLQNRGVSSWYGEFYKKQEESA